jgi:A/G-specific adenine glycosylase
MTIDLHPLALWFGQHQREMPWRDATAGSRNPYRVWLAEIMLQQTRVATVIDYYTRFLARFPTVNDMATASLDDVLALWSGLGYYSRGRNLHKTAQAVVARGGFPHTATALSSLPGVGPYTAAAVASLAFGERVAVLDGNVQRVLARLHNDGRDIKQPATKRDQQRQAQQLLDEHPLLSPGVINEGMMELGALVCTSKQPRCGSCPLSPSCAAFGAGTVAQRPVVSPKRPRTALAMALLVAVTKDGRVWLERRPDDAGLFAGLYAAPGVVVDDDDGRALVVELAIVRGLPLPVGEPIVVHRTLTHRDLTLRCFVVPAQPTVDGQGRWLSSSEWTTVGVAAAIRVALMACTRPRLL